MICELILIANVWMNPCHINYMYPVDNENKCRIVFSNRVLVSDHECREIMYHVDRKITKGARASRLGR